MLQTVSTQSEDLRRFCRVVLGTRNQFGLHFELPPQIDHIYHRFYRADIAIFQHVRGYADTIVGVGRLAILGLEQASLSSLSD